MPEVVRLKKFIKEFRMKFKISIREREVRVSPSQKGLQDVGRECTREWKSMSKSGSNRVKNPSKRLAAARSPIVPTVFEIPALLAVVPMPQASTQSQVAPLAGGETRLGCAVMVES